MYTFLGEATVAVKTCVFKTQTWQSKLKIVQDQLRASFVPKEFIQMVSSFFLVTAKCLVPEVNI